MIRNLGQVAAIYIGSSAPRNTNLIWLDNTVVPFVFRAYDGSAWSEIATHKWVRAYVDGWLVTLPPRQLADDGDYMLINSNNVNYKITVKDFVKSAVGNPLDFKGVIRVSADFPNPSTLESGDMYVIITSPAGGTVTDPYSGKTFEDSEKIVWDEVTRSWESLGKINITVNLTTSYSETEVTIHSSAGKETTIQGATDQLAGVMLPGQYSWLQALSNGSIVPGDPSPLTPLTPAHKHNYNDIINRLVSQQGTGESTIDPMSQKATTDALNLKFDKASVLQVSGAATDKVMSQKAVTDALKTLSDDFNNKLTNYLPLVGGTMTGSIIFPNRKGIFGTLTDGTSNIKIAVVNANNNVEIGNSNTPLMLLSNSTDLTHYRDNNTYKIWDSYNLSKPTVYNGGAIGTPTTIYDRNLSVNGAGWTFLSATNAPTTSIFAPTTVGTKGYYLVSSGTGAPVWQQLEDLGDGKYLPLIGGTLTGQVTIQQNVDIKLILQSTDVDNYCIIQALSSKASQLGVFGYAGDKWAIGHGGTYYEIWDKYNLSDPATKSGNNTFTGNNTFQAGKFNVGPFEVTSSGSLLSNINTPAGSAWSRSLVFRANNDIPSSLVFGGYNSVDNTNLGYAYIGIGDINYQTAQYKFYANSLRVPYQWSIDGPDGAAIIWSQTSEIVNLGRAVGTTKIRSGNTDLIHTKGSIEYIIWDKSNLPNPASTTDLANYLPLIGGTLTGQLTIKQSGNIKLRLQSTDADNHCIIQAINSQASQLGAFGYAGDKWAITHNGTYYEIWDKYNLTNPVTYTTNTYNHATLTNKDRQYFTYIKAGTNGLLPHSKATLVSGGSGSLGTSDQSFNAAYINNLHTNKITFGETGPYITGSTSATQFLNANGGAQKVATGELYVGPSYTSDTLSLVPVNGIYSRGIIYIENGIGFRNSIWTNDLTPNKNYSGYLQVLDAYDANNAGGPTNYGTVLQVNSRNAHWANQLWFSGGAEASKNGLYYRHMAYNETKYGNWIKLATTSDLGNYLPLSGGTISSSKSNPLTINSTHASQSSIDFSRGGVNKGTVGFYESLGSFLQNVTGETLAVKSDGAYYGANINSLRKLATVTDLNNYLPLTGGTLNGALTINGPNTLYHCTLNSSYTRETVLSVQRKGIYKAAFGYYDGIGAFLYNYPSAKYLFVDDNGDARVGTTNGSTKLALITDIPTVSGYATQSWVNTQLGSYVAKSGSTMTGALTMNSRRNNIVVDVVGGAGQSWNEGAGALSVQVPSDSGQTPLLLARRSGATINTTTLSERLLDMALLDTGTIFRVGMSGVNALELEVTSFTNKVGTGKLFGKQIATTDQIPSIPSISISNSGSGNAVTAISASGHTLTVTKGATYLTSSSLNGYATQSWANGQFASLSLYNTTGSYTTIRTRGNEFCLGNTIATSASNEVIVNYRIPSGCTYAPSTWVWRAGSSTSYANGYWGSLYMNGDLVATQTWVNNKGYLTSHQTIYNLTFQAGTFAAKTFDPNGAAATVNIPTKTSHITNDSGFITSSALNGYATQAWVNSQNFVKSTSTKKVTDIQPVDALPATQASGVLYLVFG